MDTLSAAASRAIVERRDAVDAAVPAAVRCVARAMRRDARRWQAPGGAAMDDDDTLVMTY